jgi:hypothetical protein
MLLSVFGTKYFDVSCPLGYEAAPCPGNVTNGALTLVDYGRDGVNLDLTGCIGLTTLILQGNFQAHLTSSLTPPSLATIYVNGTTTKVTTLEIIDTVYVQNIYITDAAIYILTINGLKNTNLTMNKISMVPLPILLTNNILVTNINKFSLSAMTVADTSSKIVLNNVYNIIIDNVNVNSNALTVQIKRPVSLWPVSITNFKFSRLEVCYAYPYTLKNGILQYYKGQKPPASSNVIIGKNEGTTC